MILQPPLFAQKRFLAHLLLILWQGDIYEEIQSYYMSARDFYSFGICFFRVLKT